MKKQWYRLSLGEKEWRSIKISEISPLAAYGQNINPGELYDGSYNQYRHELMED